MKSNKLIVVLGLIVAVVAFVVLSMNFKKDPPAAPGATSEETQARAAQMAPGEAQMERPHSPTMGPKSAPVTVVEFLDPECEACRQMHPIVKQVMQEFGDRVRLVIRYVPLHGSSKFAASALEEAKEAGKFNEALNVLFERQNEWGDHAEPKPQLIPEYLTELGIEREKLGVTYLLDKHGWKIDLDHSDATKLGVRGTPTFFIDGVMLPQLGYEPLRNAIQTALAKK